VETNKPLLILLGIYVLIRIWCAVIGTLLRALGRVKYQGYMTFAEAILHLSLGIYMLNIMVLIGLALASAISILLTRAWACPIEFFFAFRTLKLNTPKE
tara:strand:+ start:547 stop:843 length:297 start_codon:yes stop_codon:yes gene_type:complete